MQYEIKRREAGYGSLGIFYVTVNGRDVGEIFPFYKNMNSDRPLGYRTEVRLEWDALTDDTGFPNEYRTQKEAFAAVDDLMQRNGISKANT